VRTAVNPTDTLTRLAPRDEMVPPDLDENVEAFGLVAGEQALC